MANPLLLVWQWLLDPHHAEEREPGAGRNGAGANGAGGDGAGQDVGRGSAAIFLMLRRMRAPLIVLILVFSISVVGLTIIPGSQPDGGTRPMGFFEAFYFMSYTATTIGFGEIPHALSTDQRMWVTFSIYLSVVGWAYAIGTLLALVQDRGFRRAVDTQRFARQVRRIPEPFLILVGYGHAGEVVVRELDRRGRRLVVIDRAQDRIDALALAELRADVPALSASSREPGALRLAGLGLPRCEGVLALTDDDETNLAVVQSVHLLRGGLPVIARANSAATARLMSAFGDPTVVNPFDAFGDRLHLTVRTPTLAQLMQWLISPAGSPIPPRPVPPRRGSWVVVGQGSVASDVAADLAQAGMAATIVEPAHAVPGAASGALPSFEDLVAGSVGLVAAADRDTVNVAAVDAARRIRPGLFVVARQTQPGYAPLFAALHPDILLVPSEVIAREVLERLANPAIWQFLQHAVLRGDDLGGAALAMLVGACGDASPTVWQETLDAEGAPALARRLEGGPVTLGALMTSPFDRRDRLAVVTLMHVSGATVELLPGDDAVLVPGDLLLLAGAPGTQRAWDALLGDDDALEYALSGGSRVSAWWGRRLAGGR